MNKFLSLIIISFILFSCKDKSNMKVVGTSTPKPNIIYILADDLGYAEIGAYGQEKIETSNIDALAKAGAYLLSQSTFACGIYGHNFLSG